MDEVVLLHTVGLLAQKTPGVTVNSADVTLTSTCRGGGGPWTWRGLVSICGCAAGTACTQQAWSALLGWRWCWDTAGEHDLCNLWMCCSWRFGSYGGWSLDRAKQGWWSWGDRISSCPEAGQREGPESDHDSGQCLQARQAALRQLQWSCPSWRGHQNGWSPKWRLVSCYAGRAALRIRLWQPKYLPERCSWPFPYYGQPTVFHSTQVKSSKSYTLDQSLWKF